MIDFVEAVEYIGDDEIDMYDVGMVDTPHTFFANDILVHNSCYMSNEPLLEALKITDDQQCKELTIRVANNIVDTINGYYDELMLNLFNAHTHVIKTAGETIGRTGIWIIKKRYCIHKVYDLEKNKDVDKFHIKGLDVIRSSFPPKFKYFMLDERDGKKEGIIADFLTDTPKSVVDAKILNFKRNIGTFPVDEVARNTSIKEISKFEKLIGDRVLGEYPKIFKNDKGRTIAFPSHVKACINFNKLTKLWKLDKFVEKIFNGEKIKYVYLRPNEYAIEELGFRGYKDPKQIVDFIEKYYNGQALYDRELQSKIDDFYDAMKWAPATESDAIVDKYFDTDDNVPYQKHSKSKTNKQSVKENAKMVNKFFGF